MCYVKKEATTSSVLNAAKGGRTESESMWCAGGVRVVRQKKSTSAHVQVSIALLLRTRVGVCESDVSFVAILAANLIYIHSMQG